MAARRGFVTGGTWCVDFNKMIATWPEEDTSNEVLSIDRQGGGSACNLAIDMKRLDRDMPVETIGLVGDDENGRFLAAECDAFGIGRARLRAVANAATLSVDAFSVAGSGRRTHFFHTGAAKLLSPEDFDFSRTTARILHLGLPGAHQTMDAPWRDDGNGWVTVLKSARESGLLTNLELMTIARERWVDYTRPCLPHLDFLVVNDFEIGAVAGIETRLETRTDFAAVRRALEKALSSGPMRVVVAHFPEGAIAVDRDGGATSIGSIAMPADEIVGANGAGDAFAAGFLYGVHEGWDVQKSLTLAHCTAAASMRAISTTAGVPPWRECMALSERWGFRPAPA
jgi:sugar/nucleoside kinase (ribokinase family)